MTTFTDEPWNSPEADLTPEQFCSVCLVDTNTGDKIKANCKLPVRARPGGPVNRNALRTAASRVFQMVGVSPEAKRAAARKLVGLMADGKIDVSSEALLRLAGRRK